MYVIAKVPAQNSYYCRRLVHVKVIVAIFCFKGNAFVAFQIDFTSQVTLIRQQLVFGRNDQIYFHPYQLQVFLRFDNIILKLGNKSSISDITFNNVREPEKKSVSSLLRHVHQYNNVIPKDRWAVNNNCSCNSYPSHSHFVCLVYGGLKNLINR